MIIIWYNVSTEWVKLRLILQQNAGKHVMTNDACASSQWYRDEFRLAQMTLICTFMTLCKFQSYVGPTYLIGI